MATYDHGTLAWRPHPLSPVRQASGWGLIRLVKIGVSTDPPVVSHEHKRAGLFGPGEVPGLGMPEGYKRSVAAWFARLNGQAVP